MCRYALYVDVTAIYMNTGATVDLFFFSHRFTVGCNLVRLSDAFRFSLGHFSVGYRADTAGTATHQHPSIHPYSCCPFAQGITLLFGGQ